VRPAPGHTGERLGYQLPGQQFSQTFAAATAAAATAAAASAAAATAAAATAAAATAASAATATLRLPGDYAVQRDRLRGRYIGGVGTPLGYGHQPGRYQFEALDKVHDLRP
jgi:hypothetical protein